MRAFSRRSYKLLNDACKFRDKLYKMDKTLWTKAAKRFERVNKMLLEAGDVTLASHAKTFDRVCQKRAEVN